MLFGAGASQSTSEPRDCSRCATLVQGWRDPDSRLHSRLTDAILIILALLLLLPPLLAVIVDGLNRHVLDVLMQPVLWQALGTSLRIALAAEFMRHTHHDAVMEQS